MQHRITIAELRIGMFVCGMDCSWLSSPFWRRQFPIVDHDEIDALRAAGIARLTIDDARGIGPEQRDVVASPPLSPIVDAPLPVTARPRPRRSPVLSEIDRARALVERSRVEVTRMFGEARMGRAVKTELAATLVDEIAASVARDAGALIEVTRLKDKNEYTYLHSVAVCALMINLARRLGLAEADARRVGMAGLLHDIGKMGVPDEVLDKPGALDADEWGAVRAHPVKGHALLSGSATVDAMTLDVCLHHHERIDGRGYPFGKRAEEISLYARMGAICDVYDAVTSNRPYKQAWSPNEALARMREWDGHFDPDILEAFIDSIGIPPIGGLVRLRSNRLAIVTAAVADDPPAPIARSFYSIPDQSFLPLIDVATGDADPIVQAERGAYWFGPAWDVIHRRVTNGLDPGAGMSEPGSAYVATVTETLPIRRARRGR